MKYEYFIYLKIMEITVLVLGIICTIVLIKGIILMRQCKKLISTISIIQKL